MRVAGVFIVLLLFGGAAAGETDGPAASSESAEVPAGQYRLDRYHSTITFRVSHLGFSYYTASFQRFDASLEFDPRDPARSVLDATIDVSSLTLPDAPEGFLLELLGKNWLNADTHPEMTFRSKAIVMTDTHAGRMTGELTLNGRTVPVPVQVRFNGGYPGFPDLDPQARVGFSATGSLRRSDFGITLGIPEPGSNMGVGDEVTFAIETEFTGPKLLQSRPGP